MASGPAGFESFTPWEDSVVQAAAQLGFGPALGDQLTLRLTAPHPVSEVMAERLRELLDCRVMLSKGERGDV
jgi:hypothetical protein